MADYLLDRITMGTIITFRYKKPGQMLAGPQLPKDILVLAPNYRGNLHGLKITGLTPSEQEHLQMLFRAIYVSSEDFMTPLLNNIEMRKEEIQVLTQQRNQLLQQSKAVVMKPSPQGLFGSAVEKGRQIAGSIVGKIKTFGRTQSQSIPATQVNPNIQVEIQKNQQMMQQKQAELDAYSKWVQEQQNTIQRAGRVPRDPYAMYHQIIKPMIGRERMPNIYRKYKRAYIQSPRIIKSPGVVYAY